jgi:hypothetical protein
MPSKPGENSGGFVFQPMLWNAASEQSISKIRVVPWDGVVPKDPAVETSESATDQVVLIDGGIKEGPLHSMTADEVKIGTETLAREKIALLRLAPSAKPAEKDAAKTAEQGRAIARVRFAPRGEVTVAALSFHDDRLRARTVFGSELSLPVAALREVEMVRGAGGQGADAAMDTLLFKNGEMLPGTLESADGGGRVSWRTMPGTAPVALDVTKLAGVNLVTHREPREGPPSMLVRLRSNDVLAGNLVSLDEAKLVLASTSAGQLTVARDRVQAIYLIREGGLPVADGSWDPKAWESGIDLNRASVEARKRRMAEGRISPSPWTYFDGMYVVKKSPGSTAPVNTSNFNLGRSIEDLPQKVDFSFDLIPENNKQFNTTIYLFSEPERLGYILQVNQTSMSIYDAGAQRAAGGVQQVRMPFAGKVPTDTAQRRIRILTDRVSGKMTILADGVVMGEYGPKSSSVPRNLGRGLGLLWSARPAAFANLWVAPWNGLAPGAPPQDAVLLANGDELPGKVRGVTADVLKVEGEIGELEIPVNRLSMIEFGGGASEPRAGVRIRLNDRSAFTASAYRVENDAVVCRHEVLGELKFPLRALQELSFSPIPSAAPTAKPQEAVPPKPAPGVLPNNPGVGEMRR